jgi:hypothetical protein
METEEALEVDKTNFITVTFGIKGWFAVEYWWNQEDGGFWEPWTSFEVGHADKAKAEEDAKNWSINEEKRLIL